ncbi:MAG: hypothetical protein ACQETH_00905 [Candidatus Rifleibacteriota bacterium]
MKTTNVKVLGCKKQNLTTSGVTLVELLIGLFILQLIIAPLYLMFSSSKRTMLKAADTLAAANLSSSLLASLREAPANILRPLPLTRDTSLPPQLSLENLGVAPASEEFRRDIEILPATLPGLEDDNLFVIEVKISWYNRNSKTEINYIVRDIMRGAK